MIFSSHFRTAPCVDMRFSRAGRIRGNLPKQNGKFWEFFFWTFGSTSTETDHTNVRHKRPPFSTKLFTCVIKLGPGALTPYATLRFATATKRSLVLQGLVPRSRFLQICRCYNTLHPKRNDQNIVLWLGTLRHGDFSAKTSLVLQIARKSSKSYFA